MDAAAPLTNKPTIPTPETIVEILRDENRPIIERYDALMVASEKAPLEITDDEACGKMSKFLRQISELLKAIKAGHSEAKAPALAAGRAVDGFFFAMRDKLDAKYRELNERNGKYLEQKETAERRRREEAQRQAEKEAEQKRQEAAAAVGTAPRHIVDAKIDAAAQAATAATAAAEAATAKPADLARTRSDLGTVASLRSEWTGELVDRETLDLEALRPHLPYDALNQAIRGWVKAHAPKESGTAAPELRGARVYERKTAINR